MKTFPLSLLACVMLATHPTSLHAASAPQVSLVDLRPLPGWKCDPVGNVSITTANRKHLQLTKSATAQQPKVTRSGLVGWIDCSKPSEPGVLNVVKGVPIGSHLILRNLDGSLMTITSGKPIIEDWGFDPDAIHVTLKSSALHGPAVIERFTIKDGSKNGACPAYDPTPPAWAKPYLDR
jgi:hypothetical protein